VKSGPEWCVPLWPFPFSITGASVKTLSAAELKMLEAVHQLKSMVRRCESWLNSPGLREFLKVEIQGECERLSHRGFVFTIEFDPVFGDYAEEQAWEAEQAEKEEGNPPNLPPIPPDVIS
jgi:hypothetical protein